MSVMKNTPYKGTARKEFRKFLESKTKNELIEINIIAYLKNSKMQDNIIAMLAIGHKALD